MVVTVSLGNAVFYVVSMIVAIGTGYFIKGGEK